MINRLHKILNVKLKLLLVVLMCFSFGNTAFSQSNVDSDSDGIIDTYDLDDDNDGILDINENCNPYLAQNTAGLWKGKTVSNLSVNLSGSTLQNNVNNYNDFQNNYLVNQLGAEQRIAASNNISYTYTFSTPVPANEIAFFIEDLDVASGGSPTYQFSINGGAVNGSFASLNYNGSGNYLNFNTTTGVITVPAIGNDYTVMLKGQGTQPITSITISSTGVVDFVAYSLFALNECDTDGDGIPNRLDLDSDNDGCYDAIEAGENVLQIHLNNQGSIKTNATGTVNSNNIATVSATGVPQLVNSGGAGDTGSTTANSVGQPIGSSQNLNIAPCCYSSPNTNAPTDFTKTGISNLVGFTGGTTGWPNNVPNGFIAIESKNKGFVITRVKTVNDIPVAQRVEGMLVYDIGDACVKLYNGAYWRCLSKDCGIPTN